jgi:hypothetical protein
VSDVVTIRITGKIAPAPLYEDIRLEPGQENDVVSFVVVSPPFPTIAQINHWLGMHCSEWVVTSYDYGNGAGVFLSIDFEGPEVDSIIDIDCTHQIPESRTIIYIRGPETKEIGHVVDCSDDQ